MTARVALLALALLALGCRFQAHIDSRPSDESCSPGPATHTMRCPEFRAEFPVRMGGGKVCDPRGGEIIMKFVKGCILVPLPIYPDGGTNGPQPARAGFACNTIGAETRCVPVSEMANKL